MLEYIKKRLKSFWWAFLGIIDLFRHHPNAQIHLVATIVVISTASYVGLSTIEWCIILLCIAGVLALEAVNSAIEYLADKISLKHDPLIGKAKDIAAAAVLLFAIGSVVIALLIFGPKLLLVWSNT